MDLEYLDNARMACTGFNNDIAQYKSHLRKAAMELYNAYVAAHGGETPHTYQYRGLIDMKITEANTEDLVAIIRNLISHMDAPVTYDEQSNNVLECIDPNGRL